jgi:hypothetical protein
LADDTTPGSPRWWLGKLQTQLLKRQEQMSVYDRYYSGDHPLPFLTPAHASKMRDQFRQLLNESRSNFMRLVVDATEERLRVEGFRLSASSDEQADQATWALWQANSMDQESQTAILEALIKGVSYLSVWAGDTPDSATIAVEDATETIVAYTPGTNYRRRAAALKIWLDDLSGLLRANVYLPDGIYKYQRKPDPKGVSSLSQILTTDSRTAQWNDLPDGAFVKNPLGVVPIIPLRNRPRLACEGESEIADAYFIQQGINGFLFLLGLAGYFGAHRQRWMTGVKMMTDEATEKEMEPFDVAIDRILQSEDPNATFGEFGQTDLAGYIKAIEQKVQHVAITTRTPKHYLLPEGQEPSGDAIAASESGLVKKVERKQRPFGEAFEETLRLARRFANLPATPPDSEIVWADPQTLSPAVTTDAAIKRYAAGLVPWAATLEDLGYTPTQIERFQSMRLQDALLNSLTQPSEGLAPNPGPSQVTPPPIIA